MSIKLLSFSVSLLSLVAIVCGRTDQTLADKAVGEEVVDAVIDLISKSNVFTNDHRFLLRLGYIESKFGEDPNTFAPRNGVDYNGGIWQVDANTFTSTQNSTAKDIQDIHSKIYQVFALDWEKLTWQDCRKPLISALAARLALVLVGQPIPDTLEAQADYWLKNYNSATTKGDAKHFVDDIKEMEKRNKCHGRMDLAIVMDGSGSIGQQDYDLAKKFASDLVGTFSEESVNIGYVYFSADAQVLFPLDSGLTMAQMKEKIINSPYPGSGTHTSGAIQTAVDLLKNAKHREGSPRIMVVFTDGQSDSTPDVINAMTYAKQYAISSFAVGIGSSTNQAELLEIANKDATHLLSMSSYQALSESFEMMNTQTCKISQKPDIGKPVNDSLVKDEKRYFCYDITSDGITVTIDVVIGKTESYYSYSVENPSSALNDGMISGQTYIPDPEVRAFSNVSQTIRVCITVKGIEVINNFTIDSNEGNTVTTIAPNDGDDNILSIKRKAQDIAKEAFEKSKNYNRIANEICNQLSETYSKEEWICVVGKDVEISEHQRARSMFQFGFEINETSIFIIVTMPDFY